MAQTHTYAYLEGAAFAGAACCVEAIDTLVIHISAELLVLCVHDAWICAFARMHFELASFDERQRTYAFCAD